MSTQKRAWGKKMNEERRLSSFFRTTDHLIYLADHLFYLDTTSAAVLQTNIPSSILLKPLKLYHMHKCVTKKESNGQGRSQMVGGEMKAPLIHGLPSKDLKKQQMVQH
mmetsp:Transcript_8003/g.13056  ORF Transcript_8003/g.13056 Transcript_8003/m.13056 type:complete len:108 (-) Transcript_8003:64-387(-)